MCKSKDKGGKPRREKPEQRGIAKKHSAKHNKKRVYHVEAKEDKSEETKSDTDCELGLYSLHQKGRYSRISVLPLINGKELEMELDTGAAVSLIPWELYKSTLSMLPLPC